MSEFHLAGLGNDGASERAMYRREGEADFLYTFSPGAHGEFGVWLRWSPEGRDLPQAPAEDPPRRNPLARLFWPSDRQAGEASGHSSFSTA